MNKIHIANLMGALSMAIAHLKEREAKYGPDFKSAMRAGLENNLERLENGEGLVIIKEK